MGVLEAIKRRCSVRSYLDRPIESEKLEMILEAARLAPSAGNRQEWRFIVVRDGSIRQSLMKAAKNQISVGQAPVVIACCAETDNYIMSCGQLSYPIDMAIAIEHMVLQATEEGIGTCWIGAFYEDQVKEILGIPKDIRVVQLLILGYPDKPCPIHKDRLSLKEIIRYDGWEN
ncbi:MAG: nitroreductase family protein [Endomicrobiales bacterium]